MTLEVIESESVIKKTKIKSEPRNQILITPIIEQEGEANAND